MNGEIAVLDILRDDATVIGIAGDRIYLEEAEQEDELPYVIIELSDNEPFPTKSGAGGTDHNTVRVFSYANTYKQAKDLANACRLALDDVVGDTYNNVEVIDIVYQGESSFSEEIDNRKVFAKDQEFLVRVKL
jgi:hypothetical protein